MKYIKGVIHLKMNILSSLTHPHGDPTLTCMTDLLLKKKKICISFLYILWLVKRWEIKKK